MKSLKEWTPASQVEGLRKEAISSPPPLPQKTLQIPSQERERNVQDVAVPQVRPWVRYWGRYLDYAIFTLIVGVISALFVPSVMNELTSKHNIG